MRLAFPLQAVTLLQTAMCNPVEMSIPFTLADGRTVTSGVTRCGGASVPLWLGLSLWIVVFGAPVVVGIVLLRRAHRRGAVGPIRTAVRRGGVG